MHKFLYILLLINSFCLADTSLKPRHFPLGVDNVYISNTADINADPLQHIAPLVQNSIANGYYPGAIILAAHHSHIIYRGVFGNRRIVPTIAPMRFDTIFDLASLTKVVVTTTAIMQLVDQGKIQLDKPVAYYWPAFAANGKSTITIRQLLTHTSGLPEDIASPQLNQMLPLKKRILNAAPWHGEMTALQQIVALKPIYPPARRFVYSDVNFITLGYLVERISDERLDHYAAKHIFKPLGMHDTYFLPSRWSRSRIAPTEIIDGQLRWGVVHDPTAYLMGGVSGMAGLFSTAHDLGIFAQTLLNHGRIANGHHPLQYLLTPASVTAMTSPQTPAFITETRGLGWDINSRFAVRGRFFSTASYGHSGWTGTSIWIDPTTQTWLIILTNRLHPKPTVPNKLILDRLSIANFMGSAVRVGD